MWGEIGVVDEDVQGVGNKVQACSAAGAVVACMGRDSVLAVVATHAAATTVKSTYHKMSCSRRSKYRSW